MTDGELRERLRAFTGEWERLGVIADRYGDGSWHRMRDAARALIRLELVEAKFEHDSHRYRISSKGLYAVQTGELPASA